MKEFRKFLSTLICAFVPSRLHRHIIRDVLVRDDELRVGYYIKRYRECCRNARKEPGRTFPHFLSVCAIAKDEGPYFKEWLEFHRLVGVEKFYIYDNESSDNTREILEPYIKEGIVDYTPWPGKKQQLPAYNHCLPRCENETKWLAYIDLDEFLVPVQNDTFSGFLQGVSSEAAQLLIPWVVYGSDGHEKKPKGLVTESYKRRAAKEFSWTVKCAVKPGRCWRMGLHHGYVSGKTVTEDRNEIISEFMDRKVYRPHDKIRINHYHCKSWEEYQRRRARGDADTGDSEHYDKTQFNQHDLNEVFDPIMDRWIPRLKKQVGIE